jgi:hypothetical protein
MENYTHGQKLAYYKKRAGDTALTPAQRKFAQGFVDGADDTTVAYTYNMPPDDKMLAFLKEELPRRDRENKEFVNAAYNGYGQGTVSALKELAARIERRCRNDG